MLCVITCPWFLAKPRTATTVSTLSKMSRGWNINFYDIYDFYDFNDFNDFNDFAVSLLSSMFAVWLLVDTNDLSRPERDLNRKLGDSSATGLPRQQKRSRLGNSFVKRHFLKLSKWIFVGARSVDRWHSYIQDPQIGSQLSSMMVPVIKCE